MMISFLAAQEGAYDRFIANIVYVTNYKPDSQVFAVISLSDGSVWVADANPEVVKVLTSWEIEDQIFLATGQESGIRLNHVNNTEVIAEPNPLTKVIFPTIQKVFKNTKKTSSSNISSPIDDGFTLILSDGTIWKTEDNLIPSDRWKEGHTVAIVRFGPHIPTHQIINLDLPWEPFKGPLYGDRSIFVSSLN
jgi:hypothetical protein